MWPVATLTHFKPLFSCFEEVEKEASDMKSAKTNLTWSALFWFLKLECYEIKNERVLINFFVPLGFYGVDLDSASVYDIYVPRHGNPIDAHAIVPLPSSNGRVILLCYDGKWFFPSAVKSVTCCICVHFCVVALLFVSCSIDIRGK